LALVVHEGVMLEVVVVLQMVQHDQMLDVRIRMSVVVRIRTCGVVSVSGSDS